MQRAAIMPCALTPAPPRTDPSGKILANVTRFLEWFVVEFSITIEEQKTMCGVFWDYASLFQVLSAKPTRNAETTYTAIMSAGDGGHHEAYLQFV